MSGELQVIRQSIANLRKRAAIATAEAVAALIRRIDGGGAATVFGGGTGTIEGGSASTTYGGGTGTVDGGSANG